MTSEGQFKLSGRAQDRFVGSAEAAGIDGRLRTVQIHTRGALPHIRVINVEGETELAPLARIRTQQRGGPGNYRIYNVYRQHLDLISHQLLRNATALALWRRRESIMRQSAA